MPNPPRIPQRKRIFIGVEGEGEQAFCGWLSDLCNELHKYLYLDIKNLRGGAPLKMLQEALRLRERGVKGGNYSTSLILLDGDRLTDSDPRAREARILANSEQMKIVVQQPNQEGLLLRLHSGHEHQFPSAGGAMQALRVVWPRYEKPVEKGDLKRRFDIERLRVAACRDPELAVLLELLGLSC